MKMMRIAVIALLFAAVAGAAQAQTYYPLSQGHAFTCIYTNPSFHETNGGLSVFSIGPSSILMRGIEGFESDLVGFDNRKVTFAKPLDIIIHGIHGDRLLGTRWEFTINPFGPQCSALVKDFGIAQVITFTQCTDGSARTCQAIQ
ncbi:MAG TPA: hypothetical protein VLV54_22260 [Thermoanaerobaculia bacterium]|nr:hypothetical protein [Thermoanaerobaculia bacterium]